VSPRGGACRPVAPGEVEPALRLILGGPGGRRASDAQVVEFLAFALQRGIDLNEAWVVVDAAGRLAWAALPVTSPGRTMLVFAPPHVPTSGVGAELARPLVETLVRHHATRDVTLAQVLIDPHERAALRLFEGCGFARLAELIYLHRSAPSAARLPALPDALAWRTYAPDTHTLFARGVSASYEGSLDCPALNGLRDIEDVLAGHQAAGEFDPALWFVLCERSHDGRNGNGAGAGAAAGAAPLGALLLARSPRTDALELVYLGLTPGARGRGLGDLAMRHALAVVAREGAGSLSLAVDSRNAPALKLYYRHGLKRLTTRIALIRDLRV
jgi:ribosomal protein S18 acetylase RimI-like enzyme